MKVPDQASISRAGGLEHALELALRKIAELSGDDAREVLEALRKAAVDDFRNAGIPADREMEHAEVVGPAIAVINHAFDSVLRTVR